MYSQIALTSPQRFQVDQGCHLEYKQELSLGDDVTNLVLGLEEEVRLTFEVGSFRDALFASEVCDLVLGLEKEVGLAHGVGSFGDALFISKVCDLVPRLQDIRELGVVVK